MIYFVGAGPGAADLITLRGQRLLGIADLIIYTGSLVNPELLDFAQEGCRVYDSAAMTLEEVMELLVDSQRRRELAVRLHTGDPALFGAVREQYDWLRREKIPFQVVPGVSSFLAAASSLQEEYTLPGVSQTVILTRVGGRTKVPEREKLSELARHGSTLILFLSMGLLDEAVFQLREGGYAGSTPVAVVYKASWEEEVILRTTLGELAAKAKAAEIDRTALILVGEFLGENYQLSRLYDKHFAHGYRKGEKQ